MARIDRAGLLPMDVAAEITSRRERLGLHIKDLAREAGVSRDTLSDLESGAKDYRRLTLKKVTDALDRLEEAAGIGAPQISSTDAPHLVRFQVSGDFGVSVVVDGPVEDRDALVEAVAKLVRGIRSDPGHDGGEGSGGSASGPSDIAPAAG